MNLKNKSKKSSSRRANYDDLVGDVVVENKFTIWLFRSIIILFSALFVFLMVTKIF